MTQTKTSTSHRFLLINDDEAIREMTRKSSARTQKEQVATILQRCTCDIIEDWLGQVKKSKELNEVTLTDEERTGYLPRLIEDLIVRLRAPNVPGEESDSVCSDAAVAQGKMRRVQGHSLGTLGCWCTTRESWKWRSSGLCRRI